MLTLKFSVGASADGHVGEKRPQLVDHVEIASDLIFKGLSVL
jgi:hypothetical protein